jgi:hypothetical protein
MPMSVVVIAVVAMTAARCKDRPRREAVLRTLRVLLRRDPYDQVLNRERKRHGDRRRRSDGK